MNFHTIPFLASGSSLLKLKIQLKHTDASFGTCDVWNYALDWYQVVLGCLRVPKNVFAKLALFEVKFSHRPKIDILKLIQIAPIFVKHYGYSLRGVILEPLRPLEKISDPHKRSLKQF